MTTSAPISVQRNTWALVYDAAVSGDFDGTVSTTNAGGAFIVTAESLPDASVFGTYFSNQQLISIRGTEKVYIRMTGENGVVVLDDSLVTPVRPLTGGSNVDLTAIENQIAGKMDKPTGTIEQYLRGDGSLAKTRRIEAYDIVTDSMGFASVTFAKPFDKPPIIIVPPVLDGLNRWVNTGLDAKSFGLTLARNVAVTVAGISVLSGNVTTVANVKARILVIEA